MEKERTTARVGSRSLLPALAVAVSGLLGAAAAHASVARLPYSSASAHLIQHQFAAGSCHAQGSGLFSRPDPRCSPGALNPLVKPNTIDSTICLSGWTSTVRPPESVTETEKFASTEAYGDGRSASAFEYDHVVPLELGGAVNDRRNLWPEPDYAVRSGFYLNPKDRLERVLNRLVCDGQISLGEAQRSIATDWASAFRRYG